MKSKNQKGITLIALVITIIVLLILAGISLNLVMGEGGILTRAIKAKKTNDIAGVKEKVELEVANYASEFYQAKYVNSEISGNATVRDYILGKLKEGTFADNYILSKDETTGEVILENKSSSNCAVVTCTIDSNGTTSWSEINTEPWIQTGTTVTKGDVILTVGSQITGYSVTVDGTTYGDGSWYVLGAKKGELLITTNSPVKSINIGGAGIYTSGITRLNSEVVEYSDGDLAESVKSIDVDDINRVTGYVPGLEPCFSGEYYEYGNEMTYRIESTVYESAGKKLWCKGTKKPLEEESSMINFWNDPLVYCKDGEMRELSFGEKTVATSTFYSYSPSALTEAVYNFLFSDDYLLGSTYVKCNQSSIDYGLYRVSGGSVCEGVNDGTYSMAVPYFVSGVRPVVFLRTNLKISESGEILD